MFNILLTIIVEIDPVPSHFYIDHIHTGKIQILYYLPEGLFHQQNQISSFLHSAI